MELVTIVCEYCEKPFQVKEDEVEEWFVHDPETNDLAVMCGQCASRPTKRAADKCPVCNGQRGFQVGVYWESCDTCNGTGTCR